MIATKEFYEGYKEIPKKPEANSFRSHKNFYYFFNSTVTQSWKVGHAAISSLLPEVLPGKAGDKRM